MRSLFIVTTAVVLLVLSAGKAPACSCAGTQVPCQAYGQASAVFVGTVIDSRTITIKNSNYERQMRAVRLTIDSPFRGVEGPEVEVLTGLGGVIADSDSCRRSNILSTRMSMRENFQPVFAAEPDPSPKLPRT